ncbi:hypothetical protein AAFN86_21860 [Roseomonas sp. CAU 1739]
MFRIAPLLTALCLLAACAEEPPEPQPVALPLPPPAPPRSLQRAAARPQPAAIEAVAPTPTVEPVAAAPARSVWRVARDGVVGCADRAALAVLNNPEDRAPRLLAEARAAGGCRTTFRINEWVAEASDAETVQLRLTNGTPLTLWFRRHEVVAP